MSKCKIGIFVINYNGATSLRDIFTKVLNNLSALKEKLRETVDIWIVDNASTDHSIDFILRYKNLRLIRLKRNVGYGAACNIGYVLTKRIGYDYDILIFMNNDIALFIDKVITLLRRIEELCRRHNGRFLATALLINGYDNKIDYGGLFIDDIGSTWSLRMIMNNLNLFSEHINKVLDTIDIHYVDGAFIVVPAHVFKSLGGFSSSYFIYFEDVDLSLKAHMLNVRVVLIPTVVGIHYRSSASKSMNIVMVYYIMRNQVYTILKYFGFCSLMKNILFYVNYAISLLLRTALPRHFGRGLHHVGLSQKLRIFALAIRAAIDGIKMWVKKKERYKVSRDAHFCIPLKYLATPTLYERFVQRMIFDYVTSCFKRILHRNLQ